MLVVMIVLVEIIVLVVVRIVVILMTIIKYTIIPLRAPSASVAAPRKGIGAAPARGRCARASRKPHPLRNS